MPTALSILAPTRYPWRFNSPRLTQHKIHYRDFIPFNKISPRLEAVTFLNPLPPRHFDLVHAFNRIPLGPTPFIIGFESHLPRAFGLESSAWFRFCTDRLASSHCRRIIAMSHYAKRQFLGQHVHSPQAAILEAKLEVRYPNIPMPLGGDGLDTSRAEPIRLLFVGNHFARKGGCVALRIAEIAVQKSLPITIEIVSSLEMGAASWTDPTRAGFFDRDRALLQSLPNVVNHGRLPNSRTMDLMRQAHFLLLPTFSDSFGYSAIEAMAHYTPVIATDQGALPEFIEDGQNGIVLPLEKTPAGEWIFIGQENRASPAYEKIFRDEIDRLADEALQKLQQLIGTPAYDAMRLAARKTAEAFFGEQAASDYWNRLYEEVTA